MNHVARFTLCLSLCLAACANEGERAAGDVDPATNCPSGEQCSSVTPKGLLFNGPQFGDVSFQLGTPGPGTLATGGRETLAIVDADGSNEPDEAFDVATTGSAFQATGHAASVALVGTAAGSGYLRILQQGTDLLEDRTTVEVSDPTTVTITSQSYARPGSATGVDGMAVLPNTSLRLVAAILDAKGDRLVDEGLAITTTSGTAAPSGWDRVELDGFTGGTVTGMLSAGLTGTAHLGVVNAVDDVTIFSAMPQSFGTWGDSIPLTDGAFVCIEPSSGGVPVTGETFDGVTATNADVSTALFTNCYLVSPHALGPATLTVTIGSFSKTLQGTVVADPPSGGTTGQAKSREWKLSSGEGERAAKHDATEE